MELPDLPELTRVQKLKHELKILEREKELNQTSQVYGLFGFSIEEQIQNLKSQIKKLNKESRNEQKETFSD